MRFEQRREPFLEQPTEGDPDVGCHELSNLVFLRSHVVGLPDGPEIVGRWQPFLKGVGEWRCGPLAQ